jgi:hypothetical protein
MQSDLQAIKSQLMHIPEPEIMKTDSFAVRNNNTPHIRLASHVNINGLFISGNASILSDD